jgi:hypothetical protein
MEIVHNNQNNMKLLVLLSLMLTANVNAFVVSTYAVSRPSSTQLQSSSILQIGGGGVTSGLISNLAELALKLRLKGQAGVQCDVSANPSDLLLKGRVGPVTVKGQGWQSQLGLSCRAIEARVETCELDVGRILSNRKLVLTTPAKGQAMIALNSIDFANFITHPYMKKPPVPPQRREGDAFVFLKEGVVVNPVSGAVTFFGSYAGDKWRFTLKRGMGKKRATVIATPEGNTKQSDLDTTTAELSSAMSTFFNEMEFELDGTMLTFQDMMVTAKGAAPSLMLQLKITVKKFPSAGIAF